MVHARVSEELPASCEAAFDLVHDYRRRLTWDTLLRAALIEGDGPARHGAIAVCRGRWLVGGITLRTAYVSFERGIVAAVEMIDRAPFFSRWAASIRHETIDERRSRIVYTYNFRARPRECLRGRQADSRAPAEHHCVLSFERHHHASSVGCPSCIREPSPLVLRAA